MGVMLLLIDTIKRNFSSFCLFWEFVEEFFDMKTPESHFNKKCDNELCNTITNNVPPHYYDFYFSLRNDKMPTANFFPFSPLRFMAIISFFSRFLQFFLRRDVKEK
jgi:hypothetical protein